VDIVITIVDVRGIYESGLENNADVKYHTKPAGNNTF
jgi:hypothetical protein